MRSVVSAEKLTEPQVEAIQLTWGSVKKFKTKKINGLNHRLFMHENKTIKTIN